SQRYLAGSAASPGSDAAQASAPAVGAEEVGDLSGGLAPPLLHLRSVATPTLSPPRKSPGRSSKDEALLALISLLDDSIGFRRSADQSQRKSRRASINPMRPRPRKSCLGGHRLPLDRWPRRPGPHFQKIQIISLTGKMAPSTLRRLGVKIRL